MMTKPTASPIKVMIVDDSAVVRQVARTALDRDPGIEVIATASDPLFAMQQMKKTWPDVIVLDIEMPRMDGLTFLKKVMAERPTPVVICSSLAASGSPVALDALAAGAVSIITKPTSGLKSYLEDAAVDLLGAVRAAAHANPAKLRPKMQHESLRSPVEPKPKLSADAVISAPGLGTGASMVRTTERFVAIGTSTGGTQALEAILVKLPATVPGIVVVQHMPERFTAMFAERLNSLCKVEVLEAKNGDRVLSGRVLIAPGGKHMMINRSGAQYTVEVVDGPLVSRHRPSVDVLFRSCAKYAGPNALGIIMTGMGDDGARGMKEMHDAGAHTIAQDENTCVVFGMPKEAIKLGAVDRILPLDEIPAAIASIAKART